MTNPSRPAMRRGLRVAATGVALVGLGVPVLWLAVVRPAREAADVRARIDHAREALQEGRAGLALRDVSGLSETGPIGTEILAIKGLAMAGFNKPDEARPLLERSLARNPAQPMVAKVLAAVYFADLDIDRGFKMLQAAAKLDPRDFLPWYATGDVLLRYRRQPREAIEAFRQALRRLPNGVAPRIGLAEALISLGEVADANPLVDALLAERPEDPKVLRLAASRARLLARAEDVERYAGEALEYEPNDVETLLIRAQARLQSGRRQDALADAERAADLEPDNPNALALLARVEGSLGLKDRAAATGERHRRTLALNDRLERLRQEVQKRPDDPEPRWRLGQAAAEGGKTALARKNFEAALHLDPKCRPAREGLAALGPAGAP